MFHIIPYIPIIPVRDTRKAIEYECIRFVQKGAASFHLAPTTNAPAELVSNMPYLTLGGGGTLGFKVMNPVCRSQDPGSMILNIAVL